MRWSRTTSSTATNSATPSAVQISWVVRVGRAASGRPSGGGVVGVGEVEAVDQDQAEPVEERDAAAAAPGRRTARGGGRRGGRAGRARRDRRRRAPIDGRELACRGRRRRRRRRRGRRAGRARASQASGAPTGDGRGAVSRRGGFGGDGAHFAAGMQVWVVAGVGAALGVGARRGRASCSLSRAQAGSCVGAQLGHDGLGTARGCRVVMLPSTLSCQNGCRLLTGDVRARRAPSTG